MSFLGSIGHLMGGSGLHEFLYFVYAKNSICHMLSGKSINKTVYEHLPIDAALSTILIVDSYNVPVPCKITVGDTKGRNAGEECEEDVTPEDFIKNIDLEKAREL